MGSPNHTVVLIEERQFPILLAYISPSPCKLFFVSSLPFKECLTKFICNALRTWPGEQTQIPASVLLVAPQ